MSSRLDAVVIGSGPGGYVAAIQGAQLGLKVAIVEREPDKRLGGTCLLRGCIPTKALLESAGLYERMQHAKRFGIKVDNVELDFTGVQKYKDRVVTSNARGVTYLMKKNGIAVYHGHGKVLSPNQVSVTAADGSETVLDTANIVLATGSRCADLSFIPMDHEVIINSDDILEIETVPKRLIIMGAGAVGTEFATVYNRFGSKVDLIELQDHILPIEDHEISEAVAKSFKRQGINVMTSTRVQKVERTSDGVQVVVKRADDSEETLVGDILLVAVGRAPVTDNLGLDAVGVELDGRGQVVVDKLCRSSVSGIYAIGDLINTPWLAHVASHEGTLVMQHIAGRDVHAINYDHIPNCTYCAPEVASVGLTERAARERGYDVKIGTFPFSASGKAKIAMETDGLIKIVAESQYDEVLGVHITGHHATELIAEAVAALTLETTSEELVHTIHPHPTLSEVMGEAAHAAFFGQALHI